MTSGKLSRIWACGIMLGAGVYLIFDSLGIGEHAIGDGIWIGALSVVIQMGLEAKE